MAAPRIKVSKKKIADFCRRHHIRRLALFGSFLREDFRPDSDVDVLVEFEPEAQVGFIALGRIQRELSALLQRPVDLVPREGLKPKIREAVLSSAEELYAT
jgi:predicted nucleotidyltransferase